MSLAGMETAEANITFKSGYYRVPAQASLSLDSGLIPVEPNQVYEANVWMVGFEGNPGCALLAVVFLGGEGKEVFRVAVSIDDFSGRAKAYKIEAVAPPGAAHALVACRVNTELSGGCALANCKLWAGPLSLTRSGLTSDQRPLEMTEPTRQDVGVEMVSTQIAAASESAKSSLASSIAAGREEIRVTPPPVRAAFSKDQILEKIAKVKHWHHRVEVCPGIFTPGMSDNFGVLKQLDLPEDCTGLRVLDVGARDGFFSLIAEQRGAKEVIAIDHVPAEQTGFPVLREIFNSRVQFCQDNVYNLSPEKYGKFDIVLFLGVLYHLRNPLLALERIRDLCSGDFFLESYVIDGSCSSMGDGLERDYLLKRPLMEFYPRDELGADPTNWWGPNSLCLRQMLESTNFTVLWQKTRGERSILRCVVNDELRARYFRAIERGLVPASD